jgi:transformation/transcription domain-associated protein
MTQVIHIYSIHLHNSCFPSVLMPLKGKVLMVLIDVLVAKDTPKNATDTMMMMLETCVDKLEAMVVIQDELTLRVERTKKGENLDEVVDVAFIERHKIVGGATWASEKPEDFTRGMIFPVPVDLR